MRTALQHCGHLIWWQWPADDIALYVVAFESPQRLHLLLRLHPLRNDLEIERMRERDDGGHDRHILRFIDHAIDEPCDLS